MLTLSFFGFVDLWYVRFLLPVEDRLGHALRMLDGLPRPRAGHRKSGWVLWLGWGRVIGMRLCLFPSCCCGVFLDAVAGVSALSWLGVLLGGVCFLAGLMRVGDAGRGSLAQGVGGCRLVVGRVFVSGSFVACGVPAVRVDSAVTAWMEGVGMAERDDVDRRDGDGRARMELAAWRLVAQRASGLSVEELQGRVDAVLADEPESLNG